MTNGVARSQDVELAYGVLGGGDESVLLIMGLGGRAADWGIPFPERLAERFRVVSFDNRGTGSSSKPRNEWSLEDMARDATSVLDAVGVERTHVVGISMGGMIAQLIALDQPARVGRLVLMSTHFGGHDLAPPTCDLGIFSPAPGTPVDQVVRRSMTEIAAPGFAAAYPEPIEELVRIAVEKPTPRHAFVSQLQAILSNDRSQRVAGIRAPTLVVHGDLDPLIPYSNGVKLAERIPGAKLVTLRGCGHLPMWEAADELSRTVLEFLNS
jgi:3-oxoadipate enol-lactonase